jgi:hypothetical protein
MSKVSNGEIFMLLLVFFLLGFTVCFVNFT